MAEPDISGIWIVSKRSGNDVELKHFYNIVRNEEVPYKTLSLNGILNKGPLIGVDGLEVTLTPGELVRVDGTPTKFHMANVGAMGIAAMQYQYVLFKLGLSGVEPEHTQAMLAADGQFRKLLSGKEGSN